jgi:hypothetical protein
MRKPLVTVAALAFAVTPAFAAQEHLDIIGQQCAVQLGQSPAVCGCMSQSAGAQLNDNQQAFMAAQVTSNGPEIARTQALLDANEAIGVMQFMTTIVGACGG